MARRKASFARRLGWRLEAFAYDLFSGLLRLLPVDAASALGGILLRILGPLSGEHRVADLNLRLAFPEMAEEERKRILRSQWDNLGRTVFEFAIMDRITPQSGRIEAMGGEGVLEIARSGQPIVTFSGHFANWEAMGAAAALAQMPLRISYRRANNPYMDKRIVEGRLSSGIHLFAAKGKDGSRELIHALKTGEILGFLNDQRDNTGVEAPFFGHLVRTAAGPARLALSHGAALVPVSVRRLKGARFQSVAHAPIELERTGDRARDVQAAVTKINAFIEARVREAPEQWLWAHRRWPVDVYDQLKRRRR